MNKIIILALLPLNLFAQLEWNRETTDDGVEVAYAVEEKVMDDDERQVIHYTATWTAPGDYEKAAAYFQNFSNHSKFLANTEESYEIKEVVESEEWLIFYYLDPPWPLPNSDCITRVHRKDSEGLIDFSGQSAPDAHPRTEDLDRMTYNRFHYTFQKVGEDKVKISIESSFSPQVNVPSFLFGTFFPDGPAKIIKGILKGASENTDD
ncbi:MAG: hypothetical protein SchgKO_21260 [Schleiferiaceae bacterium]